MIKAGRYQAKFLETSGLGKSKNGSDQIVIRFELIDGDFAGHTLLWYGSFTGNAAKVTTDALRTLGWDGKDIREFSEGKNAGNCPAGFGLHDVSVTVSLNSYQGKTAARIDFVNPKDGLGIQGVKRMEASDADALAARLGQSTVATVAPVSVQF